MADLYNFVDINGNVIEENLHATEDTHGLMCPDDKVKLATIEDGAQANVQSNWNESDETSDSYIKNRPFYDYYDYIVSNAFFYDAMPISIDVDAKTMTFTLNTNNETEFDLNNKYSFTVREFTSDALNLIDYDTCDPESATVVRGARLSASIVDGAYLVLDFTNSEAVLSPDVEYRTHAIILEEQLVAKTIDEKYLPNINANWNENDSSSKSYIQNRPFYEDIYEDHFYTLSEFEFTEYGTSSNGTTVYSTSGYDSANLEYRIYDGAYIIIINNNQRFMYYEAIVDGVVELGNKGLYYVDEEYTGDNILIRINEYGQWSVYTDNPDYANITQIEILSQNEYVKPIDPKFLPNEATVQPNWNESNWSSPAYIHNKPCYEETYGEEIFYVENVEMFDNGTTNEYGESVYKNTGTYDYFELIESQFYYIYTSLGEYFNGICHIYNGIPVLGNPNLIDETAENTYDPYLFMIYEDGTYEFYSIDSSTRDWIRVEYQSIYIYKLDPKFLPDEVTWPSDWATSNESDPTYIRNRTHYEETTQELSYTFTDISFEEYENNEETGRVIYRYTTTDENFSLEDGTIYVVQWPDFWVACRGTSLDEGFIGIGNTNLYNESEHNSGEPFFILVDSTGYCQIFSDSSDSVSELPIIKETSTVVQLDEKFIPDTIARVSYIEEQLGNISAILDEINGEVV